MMDRLHPLVVHFPIALLTVYSIVELISLFPKVRHHKTIWYIKLFLVVVGWLGIQASLSTGEAADHAGYGISGIVERHEQFANISNILYGLAALGYALQWYLYDGILTRRGQKIIGSWLHTIIQKVVFIYRRYGLFFLLALGGIAALTVTGALGGAMVYGVEADPAVKIIIKLLHIRQP